MIEAQGGTCAMRGCNGEPKHVDHDHACCPAKSKGCGKCVRGVLCFKCNVLLGMAQDEIDRLQAAIEYLQQWSAASV